jgi:hypothetical protein
MTFGRLGYSALMKKLFNTWRRLPGSCGALLTTSETTITGSVVQLRSDGTFDDEGDDNSGNTIAIL